MLLPHDQRPASAPLVGDRAVQMVNLGGPATDRLATDIVSHLGQGVDAVVGFWGPDWTHQIVVLVTGSDDQFRVAAGGGPAAQWADIAAVTMVDRVDPSTRTMANGRIVFAPGAVHMSAGALQIVLTHELFHYAARVDTALDAPRWLTEAVADFVARPGTSRTPLPDSVLGSMASQSLPTDGDLDVPGPSRSLAYDRGWWFARFVADSYGPSKLRELYVAACGVGHSDVPGAVRTVLGVDTAGLLARWQRWMTSAA